MSVNRSPRIPLKLLNRVPEWRRQSTFRARLLSLVFKWMLYIMLIPAMLSGVVIGASLQLGSSWAEAFKNVGLVTQTTISTYQTHLDLLELSAKTILRLEGDATQSDLDMITYAAEVRSRTSALSAEIDKALADYLKRQVERSKARAAQPQTAPGETNVVTLQSVIGSSLLGALVPLILYWTLSYLLTRWWLTVRDRETLGLYQTNSQVER